MKRRYSELKSIRVKSSPFLGRGKGWFSRTPPEPQERSKVDVRGKPCPPGYYPERDDCIAGGKDETKPAETKQPTQPKPVPKPAASTAQTKQPPTQTTPTPKPVSGSAANVHPETGKLHFDPSKIKEQPKPSTTDVLDKHSKIPGLSEKLQPKMELDAAIKAYKEDAKLSTGDKIMLLDAAASGRTVFSKKNSPISILDIFSGISEEEKKEVLPYAAKRLQESGNRNIYGRISSVSNNFNKNISREDRILWADSLEAVAEQSPLKTSMYKGKMQVDSRDGFSVERMHTWNVTKNHDVFLAGFADDWAASGEGTHSQKACNSIVSVMMPQNKNKDFWSGHSGGDKVHKMFAMDRLQDHFTKLKKTTEQFYKDKLNESFTVKRGITEQPDTYLPSASESWTTEDSTAEEFSGKGGAVLEADVTYNDVLFSYESFKDNVGWPPEVELMGKEEFVIFGGALKNLTTETR